MNFDRNAIQAATTALAAKGVYIGTSSWKYPGWCGQLYDPKRYEYRGKFAKSRFEKGCLSEYAEVFKTVCVDATYYTFPKASSLEALASQTPENFKFGFKVTDVVTIKRFPKLGKFQARAGALNENFLNADLFSKAFLKPCEAIKEQVGIIMFEFSHFYPSDYAHGRDFISDLDKFLSNLPRGWPYGIEIRNRNLLASEYFHTLSKYEVSHVFNSWEAMPAVSEQMELSNSYTNPNLVAARFLLKPGRKYAEAKENFVPYDKIQEINEEARLAGAKLLLAGTKTDKRKTFVFVNNRLEGNALGTIQGMLTALDG